MASTPGRIRPWRHLAAFAGIVVALYALVFFTGDGRPRPKLGIDLQGGTRVTLTARTESGGEPPREQLLQAQSIIEQRVNGLGVSGAEVVLDGTNLDDHRARRGGRPGPLARPDRAAAVPRGHRRPGAATPAPPRRPEPAGRPGRHRRRPGRPGHAAPRPHRPRRRRGPGDAPGRAACRRARRARAAAAGHPAPDAAPAHAARRPPAPRPRPRPTRPSPPAIDAARATRQSTDPPSVQAQALRRSTARPPTRCAATTTRRCRWSAATRKAPRSTCSARASWRAPRSTPRRPRRTARASAGSST